MNRPHLHLEAPPRPEDRPSERRWTILSLGLLALVLGGTVWTASRLFRARPHLPAGLADHGPLPEGVRGEVLALLAPHLDGAELLELREHGMREFRIKGRARALLSQDFHRAFRPLVARELRPLLTPYGEVLSFEITSLDLPPLRLRAFDEGR